MIVEFSVRNFRSIKELQTISFVATGLKSPEDCIELDKTNIESDGDDRLLKTIGIYGANASGKSNIIRALEHFIRAIGHEASSESNLKLLCDPFLYQDNYLESESLFQIVLVIDGKKYRYGFTVMKNPSITTDEKSSNEIITNEWLYGTKEKNLGEYFIREGNDVKKEKLPNQDKVPSLSYKHTLFLTHAAAFDNLGVCALVRNFLKSWTISNFKDSFTNFRYNTLLLLERENKKDEFLQLLSSFNLKYSDVILQRDPNNTSEKVLEWDKIFLKRSYKNEKNENIEITLNLGFTESAGTQKLFDISGLLLRAFSMKYSVFVIIDEIDSNFHPSLLVSLIKLFNDPNINKNKSQLLFSSHDTNLMSPSIMRRDQFYFAEKNEDNSTRLYSLADLKGIRNDADFAKQYLAGYYGAVPILSNYLNTIKQNDTTLES